MDILKQVRRTIVESFHEISVHGFIFLVKRGNNILERLIWLVCIIVGFYGIIELGSDTWHRYQTSPTVITMDRSKFAWNTSFPSRTMNKMTVCSDKKIDDDKLEDYLKANPLKFPTDDSKENARNFIKNLSLISYETMSDFPLGIEGNIKPDEYLKLMSDLKWEFHPEISSGTSNKLILQRIITERGICDAVNTKTAYYNSYDYWKDNRWDLVEPNITVVVHPLELKPSQRNCRLDNESEELLTSAIYSFNLCRSQCRFKMALKECKCIPWFYRSLDKNGRRYPICRPEGMRCIGKMKDEIITLKSSKKKIECDCMANCDNSNFFTQSIRSRVWFLGANLQWGIIDYPKLQLKRELIFGLSDVLGMKNIIINANICKYPLMF
ncbi:unnamed protein product [Chironomus riparius]|uniref:Uncharacterized protein n=1 Tax=Chironomus riparius TaxID=315576 RepID=A0A9N9RQL3_9DIPT|nr:unnamed protein product [Chironomus riparius]